MNASDIFDDDDNIDDSDSDNNDGEGKMFDFNKSFKS